MTRTISFFILTCCFLTTLHAQKYHLFQAGFSIKEKRTGTEKSTLMMGKVSYDNHLNKAEYFLSFPQKERWVIQDSTLHKYVGDSLVNTKVLGQVNDFIMFKNILEYKDNDFGLSSAGFVITSVQESDEELIMEWEPPSTFKTFLKKVITHVKDNLLMGIVFYDVEEKEINKTFYENYQIIKDLPVPMKIVSQYSGNEQQLYKSITFDNVVVE
ncbi:MAG: hypothetical protein U0V54_12590 [Saprospiraceae bacterium]|nr:hypothetical protein [Saprospiraceae bacterium]